MRKLSEDRLKSTVSPQPYIFCRSPAQTDRDAAWFSVQGADDRTQAGFAALVPSSPINSFLRRLELCIPVPCHNPNEQQRPARVDDRLVIESYPEPSASLNRRLQRVGALARGLSLHESPQISLSTYLKSRSIHIGALSPRRNVNCRCAGHDDRLQCRGNPGVQAEDGFGAFGENYQQGGKSSSLSLWTTCGHLAKDGRV
jgi:hypothetical protein